MTASDTVVLDYRDSQPAAHMRTRIRRGRTVHRDPATIDSVCLHQTACRYTVRLDAEGGLAPSLRVRLMALPYHVLVLPPGPSTPPIVLQLHELPAYTHHGNGLNGESIGLAVGGLYSGLRDDPTTLPDEAARTTHGGQPDTLDPRTVQAARVALRLILDDAREAGIALRHVDAHRQSSAARRPDPGEDIWREVAESIAHRELGLVPRYGYVVGDGRAIPREWADEATAWY